MKKFNYLSVIFFLFFSCSSSRMVDSWKSKDYIDYNPKKVLIIGITQNLTARKLFEQQLKIELNSRGINAVESYDAFESTFTNSKQTEEDIQIEVDKLSNEGFDAVLISAVKGVDEKISYSGDTYWSDYHWRRFGRYYYLYQDVYFDQGYYNKYKIYHIESSLYNLKENNDKSLVWVASYDLYDPQTINKTVNNYVKAIVNSLEKEGVIPYKKI